MCVCVCACACACACVYASASEGTYANTLTRSPDCSGSGIVEKGRERPTFQPVSHDVIHHNAELQQRRVSLVQLVPLL